MIRVDLKTISLNYCGASMNTLYIELTIDSRSIDVIKLQSHCFPALVCKLNNNNIIMRAVVF